MVEEMVEISHVQIKFKLNEDRNNVFEEKYMEYLKNVNVIN